MNAKERVVEGLRAALLDQRATAALYAQLRDASPSYTGVEAFAEARRDELDHAVTLTRLLRELTGSTPKEAFSPACPPAFRDYCEGVRIAIQGESEALREYPRIISISPYREVNDALRHIAYDEEVHYYKFLRLYQMYCDPSCQSV